MFVAFKQEEWSTVQKFMCTIDFSVREDINRKVMFSFKHCPYYWGGGASDQVDCSFWSLYMTAVCHNKSTMRNMKEKRQGTELGLTMPIFFGPFSRMAFLVNKRSLFLPKCKWSFELIFKLFLPLIPTSTLFCKHSLFVRLSILEFWRPEKKRTKLPEIRARRGWFVLLMSSLIWSGFAELVGSGLLWSGQDLTKRRGGGGGATPNGENRLFSSFECPWWFVCMNSHLDRHADIHKVHNTFLDTLRQLSKFTATVLFHFHFL